MNPKARGGGAVNSTRSLRIPGQLFEDSVTHGGKGRARPGPKVVAKEGRALGYQSLLESRSCHDQHPTYASQTRTKQPDR